MLFPCVHSEGVASFAFSLPLLLGHALNSTPVLSFTQVLISSPTGNRLKKRLDSGFCNIGDVHVFKLYGHSSHLILEWPNPWA